MKDETQFAGPSKSKPRKDCYCRPCRSAYHREHYQKRRQHYIDLARKRTDEQLDQRMKYIHDYLLAHPCSDCGERDPVVLEFDHLGDKSFHVGYGVRSHAWESVLAEIEKCEVVCCNCHRRRTTLRGGFRRASWMEPATQGRLF